MKLTTVIPLYNAKDTILSTINSVIEQTYKEPIEIIVVNDGSTDGCEKLVEKLIEQNSTNRIIKLINKPNGGVSSARNRGIKEASGEWIALLDSDDIWLPEKLEKQFVEIKKNPDIKFIGTNRNNEVYPFFGKAEKEFYKLTTREILIKCYPQTSTVLIKKDILVKLGLYDETRTHVEDWDLWLKIAQHHKLYVLNKDLVYTGNGKRSFGESGLSANILKMHEGEILALKGVKKRKQINFFENIGFYLWLKIKYYRRIFIVKISK